MQILNYQEQPVGGNVIALFDAKSEKMKMIFRHLRLIRSKKGHPFIAFPSQSKDIGDGKKLYTKHYEFDQEVQKKFESDILEALKPFTMGRL